MMKTDEEATAQAIRAQLEALRAQPHMQNQFAQLQTNKYAIDAHVALNMWGLTIGPDISMEDAMRVAAVIMGTFIDNLLAGIPDEGMRHAAMHQVLSLTSTFAHDAMGFTDGGLSEHKIDITVVEKDVGDA